MLRSLTLSLAIALLSSASLWAQIATPSIDELANDHQFFEIEVTIAQWTSPGGENRPIEPQLKLEGSREEVAAQITELQKAGSITNVHRVRLMAPDKLPATVQVGMEQPLVTGSQVSPRGVSVNSIQYHSVGTVVRVVPRALQENRIAVDVEVSKSGITTPENAPVLSGNESGRAIKADAKSNLTVRTIACVVSGQTVLVSGSHQPNEGEIVLLSAREVPR